MADDKKNTETADDNKSAKGMKYIGPAYKTGLVLPTGKTVKPKDWNQTTIKKMIKSDPSLERWFESK